MTPSHNMPATILERAPADKFLTSKAVAALLGVSESWVLMHARGKRLPVIPSLKLGRSVRFRESEIYEFIARCKRAIERNEPIR
jgi:excisionase family DNA binding protein